MTMRLFCSQVIILWCLAPVPRNVGAEEREGPKKAANEPTGIKIAGWQPIFKQMAEDYRISPADEPDRIFKLQLPPVFRWTQPVRGGDDSALFVWLDHGRAAAVGTIFAWPQADGLRVVQHEFHSFSKGPINAVWRGSTVWSPSKGVERAPVPEAPKPSATSALRLRQMKTIAAGFSGNSLDPNGGRWELRLLSNPLYRYALEDTDEVLDGALFTLTQGTDPEVLLLIEAARSGDGWQWEYCCGRFSDYGLTVRYQDKEVWSVGPCTQSTPSEPYTWHVAEIRPKPSSGAGN